MYDNNGYYDKDRKNKFVDMEEIYNEGYKHEDNIDEDVYFNDIPKEPELTWELPLNENAMINEHQLPSTCVASTIEFGLGKKQTMHKLVEARIEEIDKINADLTFVVNESYEAGFNMNKDVYRGFACDCYVMEQLAESLGYEARDYNYGIRRYEGMCDRVEWEKDKKELRRLIENCEATGVAAVSLGGSNGGSKPSIIKGDVRVPASVEIEPSTKVLKETKPRKEEVETNGEVDKDVPEVGQDAENVDITIEDYSIFGDDIFKED